MWCSSFIHCKQDSKILLSENDKKTCVQRWSYNSNLSSGLGQVKCRNILWKCRRTYEITEKFESFFIQLDTNNWATIKLMTLTCSFLSSIVFKFFSSFRYLNLWCRLLPNYTTEEFLAFLPTPSSPQYGMVLYGLVLKIRDLTGPKSN